MLLQSSTYYVIGDKMLQKILRILFKNLTIFTASYSNNVFPDPLSKEEEEYYIQKHLEGDTDARNKLIEHNLRLVAHIVKKYDSKVDDSDDLISIGTIGLIKAINTFRVDKNIKLATYASRCIENEILMHLRKCSSKCQELSIDEPLNIDWEGNELLLSDVLCQDTDTVYQSLEIDEDKKLIHRAIEHLAPREKKIIELRFGIGTGEEKTQKEVADLLGISQSYISRLEKKIIQDLKKELSCNF